MASFSDSDLKQPLQDVLVCLDVDLEEELSRFRRSHVGQSTAPQRLGRGPRFNAKPSLDLITIKPVPDTTVPTAPRSSHLTLGGSALPDPTSGPPLPRHPESSAVAPQSGPQFSAETGMSASVPPSMESRLDVNPDTDPGAAEAQGDVAALKAQLSGPSPSIPLTEPQAPEPNSDRQDEWALVETAANPSPIELEQHLPTEGYLESSEELLRSATSEPKPRVDRTGDSPSGFQASLLTPLGIGSMLLLLLSSVTLSYLLVNPEFLGAFRRPTQDPGLGEGEGSAVVTGVGQSQSPDLSSQEFVELDLNTLSTLDNNGSSSSPSAEVEVDGEERKTPNSGDSETDSPGENDNQAQTSEGATSEGTAGDGASANSGNSTPITLPTKVVTAPPVRSSALPAPASPPAASSDATNTDSPPPQRTAQPTPPAPLPSVSTQPPATTSAASTTARSR